MSIKLRSVNVVRDRKECLSKITLDIADGEILLMNGDAESNDAFLNIIAGLEKASTGLVTISGYDVNAMKSSERIKFFRNTISFLRGFFLQANLSIADNIALPGLFSGMNNHERSSRIKSIAKKFEITDILKSKPSKISDIQKERVCIARTLFMNPRIILAIEPSEWMVEVLSFYTKEKNAILIISSNNPKIEKYATSVMSIVDGKIVGDKA